MESPPPSLEKHYLEKIKFLEEKNKFLENENQLQKLYIKSLNDQIELLKEKIQTMDNNNLKQNNTKTPYNSNIANKSLTTSLLSLEFFISEAEPTHILTKNHTDQIYCIAILNNKRIASGGQDSKIIIYDKNYTRAELEIVEHTGAISSLIVSSNGDLISSSCDKTLKIFRIEEINNKDIISLKYYLIQTINTTHTNHIIHVREIYSNMLVSCSLDHQINFYCPQNNIYLLENNLNVSKNVYNILEVLDHKLVVALPDELKLYDLKKRVFIKELNDIKCYGDWVNDNLCLLKNNYLAVCGNSFIYIVDLIQFKFMNKVNTNTKNICLLFWDNILITGSHNGIIQEFIVNDFNLIKSSFKEKCHQNHIWQILKDEKGNIISCGADRYIKIWK